MRGSVPVILYKKLIIANSCYFLTKALCFSEPLTIPERAAQTTEETYRVQFYTASARKARRFSIALMSITGHPPALFRFSGGGWAVQEECLSAVSGQAICRLLAGGVRCDLITGSMVLTELAGLRDR